MKFKVVGKRLILTDCSHEITEGENSFDAVEITVPRRHDNCDLSELSFRFSEISEDGKNSAVQVLRQKKCDEDYVFLRGEITSDFSAITGKVLFMLTGVNGENVAAKFQSVPYTVSDDISLMSLPDHTAAEQLFNQTQLEVQKAIKAADDTIKMLNEFTIDIAAENTVGGILSGGDISVSENGNVTVQSVNGKKVEKSVPADAVFTDTVYTLPKATKETLGGVKVDGTSIIVNKNGVISAVGGKNSSGKIILPIASTETLGGIKVDGKTITVSEDGTISASEAIAGISDLSVQIAHHNNFLIYDDIGNPSVMVAIPKFYLDEVIDGASHTVHPAFVINGIEQEFIYISKYQNIVEDNRAYSLPINAPKTWVTFDQAWDYCKNKGAGWHLMTNAEWAAVALWCKKSGIMPKGNNNCGKDISETNFPQKAIAATRGSDGKISKTLTGSGGTSWSHDGTEAGIADLNGNVFEWNSGMRLIEGEIQILSDNNAADRNNSVSADSALWKAIMPDGSLVPNGTSGTLKYDWKNNNCTVSTALSDKSAAGRHNNFVSIDADTGTAVPEIMKALALYPADKDGYGENGFYMINAGERLPLRGGNWLGGVNAGLFRLDLDSARSYSSGGIGFRCCYYDPNQA